MQSIVSIVIPTYGRDAVLVDSIRQLLALPVAADELLVIQGQDGERAEGGKLKAEINYSKCI